LWITSDLSWIDTISNPRWKNRPPCRTLLHPRYLLLLHLLPHPHQDLSDITVVKPLEMGRPIPHPHSTDRDLLLPSNLTICHLHPNTLLLATTSESKPKPNDLSHQPSDHLLPSITLPPHPFLGRSPVPPSSAWIPLSTRQKLPHQKSLHLSLPGYSVWTDDEDRQDGWTWMKRTYRLSDGRPSNPLLRLDDYDLLLGSGQGQYTL